MSYKTQIILGAIWCVLELTLIITCSVMYGWIGFGITFGICFAVRVAISFAAYVIGRIADRSYYETFHPDLGQ